MAENQRIADLRDKHNCKALDELHDIFPVPVGEICKRLGIDASYHAMSPAESGKIFLENNRCFIHVNYNHPPNRRRFTVAHELGHYCLHDDILQKEGLILEINNISQIGVDIKEIEANAFAGELLMPKDEFLKQLNILKSVEKIAEYFFVSQLSAQVRLVNLGINI